VKADGLRAYESVRCRPNRIGSPCDTLKRDDDHVKDGSPTKDAFDLRRRVVFAGFLLLGGHENCDAPAGQSDQADCFPKDAAGDPQGDIAGSPDHCSLSHAFPSCIRREFHRSSYDKVFFGD
jgi:hypothetical protein